MQTVRIGSPITVRLPDTKTIEGALRGAIKSLPKGDDSIRDGLEDVITTIESRRKNRVSVNAVLTIAFGEEGQELINTIVTE